MKKFISMVMAAAMVVSLVPATAFAGDIEGTAKIQDQIKWTEAEAGDGYTGEASTVPELRVKVTDATYTSNSTGDSFDFTVKLDGAEFKKSAGEGEKPVLMEVVDLMNMISIDKYNDTEQDVNLTNDEVEDVEDLDVDGTVYTYGEIPEEKGAGFAIQIDMDDFDKDELSFTVFGMLEEDDVVAINMVTLMDDTDEGDKATVTLKSDIVDAKDLVYAEIMGKGIAASIDDTTDVAEEEIVTLEEAVEVEVTAGDDFNAVIKDADKEKIKLKLSSGFEFYFDDEAEEGKEAKIGTLLLDKNWYDENEIEFLASELGDLLKKDALKIENLAIEATTAKAGDVATLTVDFGDCDAVKVDVAVVVAEGLTISVDEDEDVPEMWSGVAATNTALTDDDDNKALTFTIKESVAGSHDTKDVVELVLPEGVWVVTDDVYTDGVKISDEGGDEATNWDAAFEAAYIKGDHKSFEFAKRTLKETTKDAFEIEVTLTLVADPGFVGDATVEMLVDGESVGEVTIATFKAPLIVEAQQNDLKIDYRNTEVGSDIIVKEAEAGLWAEGLVLEFDIEDGKNAVMEFEDDIEYTVNEDDSDMEIDGDEEKLSFEVDVESDEEAGVVTISNLSLFMERNIPAGAYDLEMTKTQTFIDYNSQTLYAPDVDEDGNCKCKADGKLVAPAVGHKCGKEVFVDDVCDYSKVVKEGFINVVTAGREQDDASFTTKVVVPVGESYIVAGEQTITLDVPAYVSAAGYTMLPVRAVATALGINNNNVLWDAATKTVTILYGQRIITMQVGSKVINVNGSAIPASASVEIVNGRTFLPMRDLATALGVTDITWDAATKTATLNGGVVAE